MLLAAILIGTLAIARQATSIKTTEEISNGIVSLNPLSSLSETPSPEEIKLAIVYLSGNNDWNNEQFTEFWNIINCESGFNYKAYNKKDTDGLPAYSVMQFKYKTFHSYAKKYGVVKPDIWNVRQQLEVAVQMINEGQIKQWGALFYCFHC